MIVEFAVGSGDPNTAQVTVTATKLAADAPLASLNRNQLRARMGL